MTGESYADLGGQLPDESDRERGRRRIAELKARLAEIPPPTLDHPAASEPDAEEAQQ